MALKLKAMRSLGLNLPKSLDAFIKEQDTNEKLKELLETGLPDMVKYTQWKKVVEGQKSRWYNQTSEFRNHVKRVQVHYQEMRNLQENLPENEVMLWMDFAENFVCTSVEAVQSSYWNRAMVSLHTMAVYFPKSQGQRLQSFVGVSDVLCHNATVVYTILKKLVPMLQSTYPSIKTIHYLTNSPRSQYRNKTIFKILADHNEDFGIAGRWNYLESGHGKGPSDGLGASIKRVADMVTHFYVWSKQTEESGSKIKYMYYNQADVGMSNEIIQQKEKPMQIYGTFKLHAIVPTNSCTILTRETSCYCNGCLVNPQTSIHEWQEQVICKRQDEEVIDTNGTLMPTLEVAAVTSDQEEVLEYERIQYSDIQPSHWVSAVYEQYFYFDQIVAIDIDDDEVEIIFFLEKSGKYGKAFKMPSREDKLWIKREKLLTILENEPRPAGKSK
ncbi:hypothetical protein ACJMK2_020324 [Sinanodonta woodiana]|uniref:CRAL-TRIO domain-containing protein n=1 Tax=Sinanodonta woodiana TaxID=1069815 RepID=A0ABD3TYQ7_SINWO